MERREKYPKDTPLYRKIVHDLGLDSLDNERIKIIRGRFHQIYERYLCEPGFNSDISIKTGMMNDVGADVTLLFCTNETILRTMKELGTLFHYPGGMADSKLISASVVKYFIDYFSESDAGSLFRYNDIKDRLTEVNWMVGKDPMEQLGIAA
jgi:hypothetical protein